MKSIFSAASSPACARSMALAALLERDPERKVATTLALGRGVAEQCGLPDGAAAIAPAATAITEAAATAATAATTAITATTATTANAANAANAANTANAANASTGPDMLWIDPARLIAEPPGLPGRPDAPLLVAPRLLVKRSVHTVIGRAVLLHALAHIEFNAINLALDAVWRFEGMPVDYYRQWLRVAAEEAYHFSLLSAHLATLGHRYGDFPAHDGLWEMVEKTRGDVLARMALVPRTLEARGLDAAPPMRARLAQAGDAAAAAILDIILRDEIGHVAVGNRWYRYLCTQRQLDPNAIYPALVERYRAPKLKGPFNFEARRAAGFDEAELAALGL